MDQSVGAEKTGATLPAPCAEPVKLPTGRELDIKFRTDSEVLKLALRSELLSAHPTKTQRRTLRSVYFDTLSGDLHKQGTLLRVRKARSTHIMGLKWSRSLEKGTLSTSQIAVRVPSLDPAIALFGEEIALELNRVIDGQPLEQKFETQIKRRLRCLNLERSLIEVAFDEGFVVVGDLGNR